MTIEKNVNKAVFEGNGSNRNWDFDFSVMDTEHLKLMMYDENSRESIEIDKSLYSVSLSDIGGRIVYPLSSEAPLEKGKKITIIRIVPITQETDLQNQGTFSSEQIEQIFDKQTMIMQQLQENINRSVKISEASDKNVDEILSDIFTAHNESSNSEKLSRAWAIGSDDEIPEEGEHSSKGNANLAFAIANADEDIPISDYNTPSMVVIKGEKGDKGEPAPDLEACLLAIANKKEEILKAIYQEKEVIQEASNTAVASCATAIEKAKEAEISAIHAENAMKQALNYANAEEDIIIKIDN